MKLFTQNRNDEDFMILAMTLAAAADGIDNLEEKAIFNLIDQLPRLRKLDTKEVLEASMNFIIETGYQKSVEYFSNVTDIHLKNAILVLVLEVSMANQDISEDEEDIMVHFADIMGVSNDDLNKIIDVISWKFI